MIDINELYDKWEESQGFGISNRECNAYHNGAEDMLDKIIEEIKSIDRGDRSYYETYEAILNMFGL